MTPINSITLLAKGILILSNSMATASKLINVAFLNEHNVT